MVVTGGPLEICSLVLWRSAGGYRPGIFLFYEIIDNIINKPLKNYIILKCTINYNYLRHTIYSNMILLFKALIFKKHENLWC